MPLRAWPFVPRIPTSVGGGTAYRYSRPEIDAAKNGVVDRSRCVVEECINPFRTMLCQYSINVFRRLVVYGVVITEVFDALSDLLGPAGKSDSAASPDLRDLPNRRGG